MNLVLVGLNHKTAPVEIREQIAFPSQFVGNALTQLVDRRNVEEGIIVSTCNRVEIIARTVSHPSQSKHLITDFLHAYHELPQSKILPYLYVHEGPNAVRHLFRMAASLDSMVVGEPQILGQVKDAYTEAVKAGVVGRVLHKLLSRTFSVAKRIRTETNIATYAVSLSFVAVELAKKIFEDLKTRTVLLIGAGEMAELAAKHLVTSGVQRVFISNRTVENATNLASTLENSKCLNLDELDNYLPEIDVVIASTGAQSYVINSKMVQKAISRRRNKPMLLIDMSVPRNIDPAIAEINEAFVFDIDDMENVISSNISERQREAKFAEEIIEMETEQFITTLKQKEADARIIALKEHLTEIAHVEYERNRKHLGSLTIDQEKTIKKLLLEGIINKFAHPLIVGLREASNNGDSKVDLNQIYPLEKK